VISLIHPSRGRPQQAFDTMTKWIDRAGARVEYILSLDEDDPTLSEYQRLFNGQKSIVIDKNTSVVEATNVAAKCSTGNILLYLSDDFDCFEGWGYALEKEFSLYSGPVLLKVDDCLQRFTVRILTIRIMNRECYDRLGYFWHPDYRSMWVDCDLYETASRRKMIQFAPHLKFEHLHPSNGKAKTDETYTRSAANWNQGKAVFDRRKRVNFP